MGWQTAAADWRNTWDDFDFARVEWRAVGSQWATISSLAFFTLILVPIRIPSLSIITGDEVKFDDELKVGAVNQVIAYNGLFLVISI